MFALGHKRTWRPENLMSALPSKADIVWPRRHESSWPPTCLGVIALSIEVPFIFDRQDSFKIAGDHQRPFSMSAFPPKADIGA